MTPQAQRWPQALAIAAWILPIACFVGLLAANAENVPQWDDFPSILAFAGDWHTAAGATAKWALLHEQYFSHRIILTKLLTLGVMQVTGQVNFVVLQALGWTGWVFVFGLLARQLPAGRRAGWAALPLSLLLMQPQGYSNHLIAMQAVQNIGIILWAFGALALLQAASLPARAVSLVLIASAPLVSANGLMVLPAAILALVFVGAPRRLIPVVLAGAAGWAAFFAGYASTAKPLALGEVAANAAAMAGSPAAVLTFGTREALVAGTFILAAAGSMLVRRASWRTAPVATAWLCFLVLSILMAARGRVGWGTDYMLQDRYRLYGLLIVGLLYVSFAPALEGRWPGWSLAAVSAAAGLFCFVSYVSSWPVAAADLAWARASACNRQLGGWVPSTGDDYWKYAVAQLQRAETLGYYRLPRLLPEGAVAELRARPAAGPVRPMPARPNADVFGRSLLPDPAWGRPDFAVLAGAEPVVLPVHRHRASLRSALRHATVFGTDYSIPLPNQLAPKATAAVAGVRVNPAGQAITLWSAAVSSP